MDRIKLLCFGFAVLFCADLCIGYANHVLWIFLGAAFWGIQRGIVDSMFSILVSSFSPKEFRGTGFGVYYIVVSISTFLVTTFAGFISAYFGEAASFGSGAVICLLSMLILSLLRRTLNSF